MFVEGFLSGYGPSLRPFTTFWDQRKSHHGEHSPSGRRGRWLTSAGPCSPPSTPPRATYLAAMRLRMSAASGRTQTDCFSSDIFVHCNLPPQAQVSEIENPKLVIGVLSPRTEEFDRTGKFTLYSGPASLEEQAFAIAATSMTSRCIDTMPAIRWFPFQCRAMRRDGSVLASILRVKPF